MTFLAGWMTLLAGVLILRWTSMPEAERAFSIITPDQIIVNVFASIVFWGLLIVTRQNTTVAGIVGMVLYFLFALATVWAVGNKAADINVAKNLKFGDPEWQKPIDMLVDPTAAMIHCCRFVLLFFVVKAKWRADEHWELVGGADAQAHAPAPIHYTTQADLANNRTDHWEILEDAMAPKERPLHITVPAR